MLVVEEEDRLRHVCVRMLGRLGLQVIEAATGPDAVARLDEREINLLFTGVELGGEISGIEIADRALARYPHACVLFTTGHTRKAIPASARFGRCAAWITKPYSQTELGRAVADLLGGKR